MVEGLILIIIQLVFLLVTAPFVNGVIKKTKAFLQCRRGPSVWQPYWDLIKYSRKDAVVSENSSWLFPVIPYVVFASVLTAGLLIPTFVNILPLSFTGDLIAVIYLFALGRFFMALAGLDTGSAFGGMGSSREMAISAIVEPVMMLSLFVIALTAKTTVFTQMVAAVLASGSGIVTPPFLFAFVGLMIVAVAETGRIPVDNPDTHLELTMVHEGMLLEYSGKHLTLMVWAALIKQLLIFSLIVNLFFPWGIATALTFSGIVLSLAVYLVKVVLLGMVMAVVETSFAKMRLFKVPELIGASFLFAVLALVSYHLLR